jgi:hypothetical protein
MKSINSAKITGIAIVAAIGAMTTLAFANPPSPTQQKVNAVEYSNNTLLVQLADGSNYVGSTSAPAPCTSASVDTLKVWASQAQAALLSGHTLKIYYTNCNSTPFINTIDIWNN